MGAVYKGNYFSIDKIEVGKTKWFTYKLDLKENGKNSNPAKDTLKLTNYKSNLFSTQDGLKYPGKGTSLVTNIYAGSIPATTGNNGSSYSNADLLSITVKSNKTSVKVGEVVNYTVTVKNKDTKDITGIYLSHSYPKELSVYNTGGGSDDGHSLHFKLAQLQPGASRTFSFSMKVLSGATGASLRSLTGATVNEYENISPVASYLSITDGKAAGKTKLNLAQTGPMSIPLLALMSFLGYFGYRRFQKRRYLKLRAAALRDI